MKFHIMIEYLIFGVFTYLVIGLIASIFISFRGVKKLDSASKDGTMGFKLLIIPGLCVFWPLFVLRLNKGLQEPPSENNAHRNAAKENMK
ncbi:MAG: hypothetical protein ABJR05_16885 [Balneola sp.]